MTVPKLKPCPKCETADHLAIYTYESGTRRVECDGCWAAGPCCTSKVWAARHWNERVEGEKV